MILDNRTELPDEMVANAARTYIEETSAYGLRQIGGMTIYSEEGSSLMTRMEYKAPGSIEEEIRLARHMAERDDDVSAVIGEMIGLAFSDGVEVKHADEKTQALFTSINEAIDIEGVLANMYREWLIAAQVNTAMLFSREELEYEMSQATRTLKASMAVPRVGVLASENVRVIGNDTFGTAILAYDPDTERLRRWLREYFNPQTTPGRKAEMGREDRVAANLFLREIRVDPLDFEQPTSSVGKLYVLNPKVVQRLTMPKGSWRYPRPMLTRNFPLLEAKRLLNVMDFALLQGGSNFIVVAKKGSDQRPAKPAEIANLREVVRRASKVGLIVGDHRLNFEIITPKLDELLNPAKRRLIGRKLAMAMMRIAEHPNESGEEQSAEAEVLSRVVAWDRGRIASHVKRNVYAETVRRNPDLLKSPASLWFLRIILQGSQYFTDFVLKLRDRGDISRKTAVQAGGFDYEAELQERERELESGHDEVLIPGTVPHTSPQQPGQQPQINDNGGGRPNGGGPEDKARPKQTIGRVAGETIKAWYDEDPAIEQVVRMGEQTAAVLEDYADREIGRITGNERAAMELAEPERIGSTIYVPVNPAYEVADYKAVRLAEGLSMLVGTTRNRAIVAKVLCFREPQWTEKQAEETALRWGFITREMAPLPAPTPEDDPEPDPEPEETAAAPPIEIHLHMSDDRTLVVKDGKVEPEPDPTPEPGAGS